MNIVSTIIDAIGEFVGGIGSAFVTAFQNIFMIEGTGEAAGTFSGVNDLGQVILIFFGISLGYGVVRFITSLFRREAK